MSFYDVTRLLAMHGNEAKLKVEDYNIPVRIEDIRMETDHLGATDIGFTGHVITGWPKKNMYIDSREALKARAGMTIKKVIFNEPATIVIWADGTKTVVKAQNNETYDPEKGLAMAIAKKALGNEGKYYNEIKKWTDEYDTASAYMNDNFNGFRASILAASRAARALASSARATSETIKNFAKKEAERNSQWLAYQRLQNALHDKKATKADLLAAMEEASGYLGQVLDDHDVDTDMHAAIGKAVYD